MSAFSLDLVDFFRSYVALSSGMRFEEKRTWWDEDEPNPVLKPEESAEILTGWPSIQAYWDQTRFALRDLHSAIDGIQINHVSQTWAITTFQLRWQASVDGPFLGGAPLGALVRVTAATKLKSSAWRIFAYIEAHVDPITYVRKMAIDQAEEFARTGFGGHA